MAPLSVDTDRHLAYAQLGRDERCVLPLRPPPEVDSDSRLSEVTVE